MIQLGKYANLEVVKTLSFGAYLDAGPFGEVLLPKRYVPKDIEVGQEIRVFLYCDSEDRVIATTDKPYARLGDIAALKVTDVAPNGAYLDWGLMKDLFVPFREQEEKMQVGKTYIVKVLFDEATDRIYATAKISKFLIDKNEGKFKMGDEVKFSVWQRTDLGYKVIIDNQYIGLLFKNEVFQPIQVGKILRGYIKNIREDDKIDVCLQKSGYQNHIPDASNIILEKLKNNNGFLYLTDNSDPVEIYEVLGISKKAFKKAVGNLYKQQIIALEKSGIKLISQ